MHIRKMKSIDNPVVQALIQESLVSLNLAVPGSAYFDPQLGSLAEYYQDLPQANYWVIEHEGKVVGGVGIAPFQKQVGICELQKLYLLPEVKGRGWGNQLMERALSFAQQHYTACYLETMLELKAACQLYEKYGFTRLKKPLPDSEHGAMDAWYLKTFDQKSSR